MRKIHSFLASHRQEAFTMVELAEELDGFDERFKKLLGQFKTGGVKPSESHLQAAFAAALDKLVEIKAVDSRAIHGEGYYASGESPLPL